MTDTEHAQRLLIAALAAWLCRPQTNHSVCDKVYKDKCSVQLLNIHISHLNGHITTAGCLKLLATALDGKKKHVAEPVVHTFYSLMNTEHLSAQQRSYVKKLLAQLHGMRRCSVMLCPVLTVAELKQLPGTTASCLLWWVQAFFYAQRFFGLMSIHLCKMFSCKMWPSAK